MYTLLALLYVVQAMSLPSGMAVDLDPSPGGSVSAPAPGPPPSISLSKAGTVGVIMYPEGSSPLQAQRLLIVRGDGTRTILDRPSDAVLSKFFKHYPGQPQAYFAGLKFARDGTPFATVISLFSGAFSGSEDGVFKWNGDMWMDALSEETPPNSDNVTLGAADQPWRAVYNVNYNNTFIPDLDYARSDPHFQEYWSLLGDGKKYTKLGFGTSTAMRDATVVGFSAGLRSLASFKPLCVAWEWVRGLRVKLGSGVPFDVNANGDVVGDDEPVLGSDGVPVLWHSGQTIKLSESKGSAFAIADDGTIVGRVGGDGFIIRGKGVLTRIDTLLATPGWHVTAIYGIATSGRLLAVGQKAPYNELKLLLLDPKS